MLPVQSTTTDRRKCGEGLPDRPRIHQLFLFVFSFTLIPFHSGCMVFHRNGDTEFVHTSVTTTSDVSPDSLAAFQKGLKSYKAGKCDLATKSFEKAIQLDPTNGRAHNNLGLIWFNKHRLSQAAFHFDSASQLLPEDPTPLNNLGMTLEAGGRTIEAIDLYRQASQLDPSSPLYLGNLVRSKIRMGDQDELTRQQMQDLAMIEYRPRWVRWVQDQLALDLNPMLDRGGSDLQQAGNLMSSQNPPTSTDAVEWETTPSDLSESIMVPASVANEWTSDGVPLALPVGVVDQPVDVFDLSSPETSDTPMESMPEHFDY
ncbi:Tetratricopeptide repeat protein [Planctomycetes bacterium CA13]|uniref:Tetratricopeptide repeat protein n=1 Tax=Novipirellula herctigrandis TaxID=2527986 RepID=A0A5C5Z5A7_9BACT|nr:Tetratricopeptide repeat protein [Planctomycetes bacterium CA13]